eukprot:CAMPEP_0183359290 /NCGR_PEP_ID=MMETSP0164_2-20130417/51744_1 /TAXON_ID=221442 /ORGANISM="Coccolithus pelagicus ssp braarudi, Strain PLY182g" /LENGTH=193 /DNA_ID=CAMNT_0025533363 /DNA_START=106 /DNA_END=688 /DNA_ORIENTATION=+
MSPSDLPLHCLLDIFPLHVCDVLCFSPTRCFLIENYLTGKWSLTKALSYTRGGVTSTFSGAAVFERTEYNGRMLLLYEEQGQLAIGSAEYPAHRRLLWDCTCEPTKVYFFDSQHLGGVDAVVTRATFFHAVHFNEEGEPVQFHHPCIDDMYTGRLRFQSPERFDIHWRVSGPRKLGLVDYTYERSLQCNANGA